MTVEWIERGEETAENRVVVTSAPRLVLVDAVLKDGSSVACALILQEGDAPSVAATADSFEEAVRECLSEARDVTSVEIGASDASVPGVAVELGRTGIETISTQPTPRAALELSAELRGAMRTCADMREARAVARGWRAPGRSTFGPAAPVRFEVVEVGSVAMVVVLDLVERTVVLTKIVRGSPTVETLIELLDDLTRRGRTPILVECDHVLHGKLTAAAEPREFVVSVCSPSRSPAVSRLADQLLGSGGADGYEAAQRRTPRAP